MPWIQIYSIPEVLANRSKILLIETIFLNYNILNIFHGQYHCHNYIFESTSRFLDYRIRKANRAESKNELLSNVNFIELRSEREMEC